MIIIITLLILGLIITLHEFGHFSTAKYFKMPVSEFSIGMGPIIYSKKINDTKYSIRIIPIGGFVSIEGMMKIDKNDKEYSHLSIEEIEKYNREGFISHPKCEQLVVLLAGVFMNFLTAFTAYLIYSIIVGYGFMGAINGFLNGFINTFKSLELLITGKVAANNLVGPVGLPSIFKSQIEQNGFIVLLPLFAILSINIGILNLIPIPAVDGGRVVFVLLEACGIKLNKKIEETIHTIGFVLIMLLMIYVFYNDIMRIVSKFV